MTEQQEELATTGDGSTDGPDDGGDLPPEVQAAIAEHPEEVARFLDNLGAVNDLLDGTAVATSAMDDEMVQNLAATGTNLGAAAEGLATPAAAKLGEAAGENADDLAEAIETLARLQRSGTLDDVLALADTLSLLTAAMDDEMVQNLTATGSRLGELADTAADEAVAGSLESVLEAVGEASDQPPEPPGVVGTVRALRDPDVQSGMGFLLAIARALGRDLREE
ncbi:DUF1641 domain-containing protein [Halorientalis pallida]|uniref:DUF1641 domain-containing protein n=1 Tax=Halorientalis pallida TaxID=2479928 RepID=A0A498KQS3_9EURY|nr:DUF1641 domain-containing protein [Halorientalis pallida]RXK46628.1 DUF1641 domain-containing protein [Halorientalis pallida]